MSRSLIAILIMGTVNLGMPALASAADDLAPRTEATSTAAVVTPGAIERSIAAESRRLALQSSQPGPAVSGGSNMACKAGGVLLAGAAAAFVVAYLKHQHWEDSGATTVLGAKPPNSVGIAVGTGLVLAGAGIFTMSKSCGQQ